MMDLEYVISLLSLQFLILFWKKKSKKEKIGHLICFHFLTASSTLSKYLYLFLCLFAFLFLCQTLHFQFYNSQNLRPYKYKYTLKKVKQFDWRMLLCQFIKCLELLRRQKSCFGNKASFWKLKVSREGSHLKSHGTNICVRLNL